MKKYIALMVVTLTFLFTGTAFTTGIAPQVAIGPDDGWVAKTEDRVVPAPTTMLLLGFGLIGLAGFRRKLRKD